MYSPNAAYEAGRRLGRRHSDPWISEDELLALISQEITPQIRPRNAQLMRDADSSFSLAAGLTTLSALSVAFNLALTHYGDRPWMPVMFLRVPEPWVIWVPVVLAFLTILSWIGYWMANARARRQRRRLRQRLTRAAYNGAAETLTLRRTRAARDESPSSNTTRRTKTSEPPVRASLRSSSGPMRIFRTITPRDAEELAAQWMRSMGAEDVEVTRFQGDGGIDVTSNGYIAQVKHFATNVGVAPVRELSGVVRMNGRRGLFFATNGYSTGAVAFANNSGIALFRMHPDENRLTPENDIAAAFLKHGLNP
ncbi:MAG: restriction endonuclease [Arachnia sp.]